MIKIKKNSFIHDVVKLVFGTVGSYIVFIAATPILTRIYNPEDFGFFSLFYAVILIIGSITCFSYDIPVLNATKRIQAYILIVLTLVINGIVFIVIYNT